MIFADNTYAFMYVERAWQYIYIVSMAQEKKGSVRCVFGGEKNREKGKKCKKKREKKVMSSPFRVRQRIFFVCIT